MKKTMTSLAAAVVLAAALVLPTVACSGCSSAKAPTNPPAAQKKVVSAVCPVMGNRIPDVSKAAAKSVYKGKTYYFCCKGCKPLFDKNPGKYIKKDQKK